MHAVISQKKHATSQFIFLKVKSVIFFKNVFQYIKIYNKFNEFF